MFRVACKGLGDGRVLTIVSVLALGGFVYTRLRKRGPHAARARGMVIDKQKGDRIHDVLHFPAAYDCELEDWTCPTSQRRA